MFMNFTPLLFRYNCIILHFALFVIVFDITGRILLEELKLDHASSGFWTKFS